MLGNIKDRIAVLGEGIKSQFGSEIVTTERNLVLEAGSEVLSHYQVGRILVAYRSCFCKQQ